MKKVEKNLYLYVFIELEMMMNFIVNDLAASHQTTHYVQFVIFTRTQRIDSVSYPTSPAILHSFAFWIQHLELFIENSTSLSHLHHHLSSLLDNQRSSWQIDLFHRRFIPFGFFIRPVD